MLLISILRVLNMSSKEQKKTFKPRQLGESYEIDYEVDGQELQRALLNVLETLGEVAAEYDQPKVFVDGEFDSNQTNFEYRSNHCEIGVVASSKQVGYTLLLFLRMIIDNRFDLAICYIVDSVDSKKFEDKEEYSTADLIKVYEEYETSYSSIHDPAGPVTAELSGCDKGVIYTEVISMEPKDMDLWDLTRIRRYVINYDFNDADLAS